MNRKLSFFAKLVQTKADAEQKLDHFRMIVFGGYVRHIHAMLVHQIQFD
jgi:hypothetical protein